MKILAVIGAFAIMILFAFVCGAIIAEEWLSKLKKRKGKEK